MEIIRKKKEQQFEIDRMAINLFSKLKKTKIEKKSILVGSFRGFEIGSLGFPGFVLAPGHPVVVGKPRRNTLKLRICGWKREWNFAV